MDPATTTIAATTTTATDTPVLFGPVFSVLDNDLSYNVVYGWVLPVIRNALNNIAPFSFFITLLFITGVVYVTMRINKIRTDEYAYFMNEVEKARIASGEMRVGHNPKWEQVQAHVASANPNDWRIAIIEADIMLEDMINAMGYSGESLGEKLRNADEGKFSTIDKAWEAHRVRNQIAHQGAAFVLSEREARRVINLYRDVFDEFKYI